MWMWKFAPRACKSWKGGGGGPPWRGKFCGPVTHVCSLKSAKNLSSQLESFNFYRVYDAYIEGVLLEFMRNNYNKLLVFLTSSQSKSWTSYLTEVAKEYPKFELSFFEPHANGLWSILWIVMHSLWFNIIPSLMPHFQHGHITFAQSI